MSMMTELNLTLITVLFYIHFFDSDWSEGVDQFYIIYSSDSSSACDDSN